MQTIRQPQRDIRSEQGREDITSAWKIYSKRPKLDAIRAAFNYAITEGVNDEDKRV